MQYNEINEDKNLIDNNDNIICIICIQAFDSLKKSLLGSVQELKANLK